MPVCRAYVVGALLALAGLAGIVPRPALAQIQVVDSLGGAVPYAILESPSGQRVVTDAAGMARQARPADGPWLARRIGYRPARSTNAADRIVMSRLPALLSAYRVEDAARCTAQDVAAQASAGVVEAVRTVFAEYAERRELASQERTGFSFAVETILETEDGRRLEVDSDTVTMPVVPSARPYEAGRAMERIDGDWIVRRPSLGDLTSNRFLETHCLSITEHAPDSLSVVRFMPREDLAGPQLIGRYVVDQRTGRLHSDTLDYLRPPKGAPGQARMVGRYAEGAELLAVPLRIVETVSPSELRVSLNGRRLRVVRTERTLTRLWPSAPPPGDNGRQALWREGGEHRARRPRALVPPASRFLTASPLPPPLPRRPTAHPA